MSVSDTPNQNHSQNPAESNPSWNKWRKHQIFAGLLTIYIGYSWAMTLYLAVAIRQSYGFLAGVMSGLGGPSIANTLPFPSIIIILVFLIGGLIFCGRKGRGRPIVWIAALIAVPVAIWEMNLLAIVPGRSFSEPNFISLIINLIISIYLVWVLVKTKLNDVSMRDWALKMVAPKNLVISSLVVGLFIAWTYRGEISFEYSKENWEPSKQLSGLSIGAPKEQFKRIKGKFYGCRNDICSWHFRSNKRPDLIVYLKDDKVKKIHTISPRVTGDTVPFDTVAQMREILGPEDIRSEGYQDERFTYIQWNVTYEWAGDVLTGISLGEDDWYHAGRGARYYIKGKQVCPSEACPWNEDDTLKPEFEYTSYKDYLEPSPKLLKMLDEAQDFEKERYRLRSEAAAIRMYAEKAERGEALAQYRLGNMYYNSGKNYGLVEDYPKAEKWVGLAAAQDYTEAQHLLGIMYEEGDGVNQDFSEAMNWYQKAIEKRYKPAMSRLGSMYMNGKGVPKNNVIAYQWFQLSAMGDNEALKNREVLEKILTEDEKAKANAMAAEWHESYMSKLQARRQKGA